MLHSRHVSMYEYVSLYKCSTNDISIADFSDYKKV